ncbi:MAG: hypothetical protein KDA97_15310, partial [Acidimicrobiales bacterium]|nr:hypothetical protein [Acidimicrobiales bacterium]
DYQHHLRAIAPNTYSYFDNGNRRFSSRGAVFQVDVGAQTATYTSILEREPAAFGPSQGTMQPLPGGGFLVGWGGLGVVTEYDASGQVVFDATLTGGTYRQYRSEWTGAPVEAPRVVATPTGGQLSVAVSWNGDTRAAQWRILAGASSGSLAPVTTVARTGFETTTTVPAAAHVGVEALSSTGEVIGRSTTVAGAGWFEVDEAPAVNGTYRPLVGDFAGGRNDDVIYYAPGGAKDYLHIADGEGGFTDVALPGIDGSYQPLVGDFVGDDREDVLFTQPGSTRAYLWRFDGRPRGEPVAIASARLAVPGTVTEAIVLDHRPSYGGPRDEVLWYAAGSAADRVDHYGWPSGGSLSVTSRSVRVNGRFEPVSGDFDGNGFADVLWYAAGSTPDYTWFHAGTSIRSTGHRSNSTPVNGSYQVHVGDFSGSPARHEIAFNATGPAADHLWSFAADGGLRSTVATTSLAGFSYVLRGGDDRLLVWGGSGTSPDLWGFDPLAARPSGVPPLDGPYQPLIGDFVGPGGTSSVLWYAPGSTPERLHRAT